MEYVVLVDKEDNMTGTMEKLEAHISGKLHRAISVFIFNSKGELLLQRRAGNKYHSANLWTNTCCSHPRPGEDTKTAANRRLQEEMGLKCELTEAFTFTYKVNLDSGLTEHELDHVFTGVTDLLPSPDISEAAEWKYINIDILMNGLKQHPEEYTEWFKICCNSWHDELFGR